MGRSSWIFLCVTQYTMLVPLIFQLNVLYNKSLILFKGMVAEIYDLKSLPPLVPLQYVLFT